ncbi:uncharacterized protein LOC126315273 [Schistocerca gregaria]|uniref:uncharacterized protein LOC126315273 n=1 Tax=Schistocerca gregaria TaxID=7010 RepID=UPI00211E22C1|nr:uncharacterized protein LOC126315273 [Schistocerca gregaria]
MESSGAWSGEEKQKSPSLRMSKKGGARGQGETSAGGFVGRWMPAAGTSSDGATSPTRDDSCTDRSMCFKGEGEGCSTPYKGQIWEIRTPTRPVKAKRRSTCREGFECLSELEGKDIRGFLFPDSASAGDRVTGVADIDCNGTVEQYEGNNLIFRRMRQSRLRRREEVCLKLREESNNAFFGMELATKRKWSAADIRAYFGQQEPDLETDFFRLEGVMNSESDEVSDVWSNFLGEESGKFVDNEVVDLIYENGIEIQSPEEIKLNDVKNYQKPPEIYQVDGFTSVMVSRGYQQRSFFHGI